MVRVPAAALAALILAAGQFYSSAAAQEQRAPCGAGMAHLPVAHARPVPASAAAQAVRPGQLRLDYVDHSTFLVTSAEGVRVITDYNDNFRAEVLPHIALMSAWHQNHSTPNIDKAITHVLRGWSVGPPYPRHDVTLKDVRVYSVPVNIPSVERFFQFPNSIFVVQSGALCIAHLGLLAHTLDDRLLTLIGRVDVALVPIDLRVSMSVEGIIHVLNRLSPKIAVPMHFFTRFNVEEFLGQVSGHFTVRRPETGVMTVDKASLPTETEIHFLTPRSMAPPGASQGRPL